MVEAFKALNVNYTNTPTEAGYFVQNESLDLAPHYIGIQYPVKEIQWPCMVIQFHPNKVEYAGLSPDSYTPVLGSNPATMSAIRTIYFEGAWDISIVSTSGAERDRLWDTLFDVFLMDPLNPASNAFYGNFDNYDLMSATLLKGTIEPLGDSIGGQVPWNENLLAYEASVRMLGNGNIEYPPPGGEYPNYNNQYPTLSEVFIAATNQTSGTTEDIIIT